MIYNIAKLVVNRFFVCLRVIKCQGHAAQVKVMAI